MSSSSRVPSSPHHPRPARALVLRLLAALLLALGLLGPLPIAYAAGNLTVRVYSDSDRNGAYNGADAAVPGVTVRVYNQDNVLVGLNSTAADGTIAFPTLQPGAYRVEVAPSAARAISVFGAFPPGNSLVSFVALPDNTTQTLDVGVRPLAGGVDVGAPSSPPPGARSIVARLWDDQDANGIQDAAEPGIPGLQVAIIDVVSNSVVVPAVTTNAEGYAVFSDTAPTGTGYALRVLSPVPTGYALTRPDANDGGFNPDQRDSDAALTAGNVEAPIIPGDTGANNDSIDIGFARGGISGFIFRDVNRNGGFDGVPESFLDGITVELRDSTNAIIDTQVTRPVLDSPSGEAGFFEFTGVSLNGGPYKLVVPSATFVGGAPLFGAANSPNAVGGDKGLINGTAPSGVVGPTDTVQIGAISITGADTGAFSNRSADNNFGFYQGSVGDLVWFDLDRDGVVDPGEDTQGINGVRLFVDDGRGAGTPGDGVQNGGEPSTLTTVSGLRPGFYRFDNLPLGVAPGRQYEIVLDEANFLPGGLLDGLGASTGVVRTNANGNRIVVIQSPGLTDAAPAITGADFGVTRAELGNFVWEDSDGDGLFDVGEPPVPGVTVQLFTPTDVAVGAPVVTGAAGEYTVPTLPAGSYYAQFTLDPTVASPAGVPAAYLGSLLRTATYSGVNPAPAPGAADENDLSAQVGMGRVYRTPSFAISAGSVNVGVDAALFRPVTVAGSVFYDLNFNNVNNGAPSDAPLQAADVRVIHTGPDRTLGTADDLPPFSTTTNVSGAYAFDATQAIPPGRLVVQFLNPDSGAFAFVTPNVGADEAADSDVTGTTLVVATTYGLTDALDASSNQALAKLDAGFTGTTTLSGTAFVDGTANGVRGEASDSALEGTKVALDLSFSFGATPLTLSRAPLTDATGAYSFAKLPTGSFDLVFTPPSATPGYIVTYADVADNSDSDSDGASATDGLLNQSLTGGAAERRDQGYYQPIAASGRVFFDRVPNSRDEAPTAEPGVNQVAVELTTLGADSAVGGAAGTPNEDQVVSTTTDSTGAYAFLSGANLRPGAYRIAVTNPSSANFAFVQANQGDDALDSDVDQASGLSATLDARSSQPTTPVFAGFTGTRTVSGLAWVDTNGSGVREGSDTLLPGANVALTHTVSVAPYLTGVTITRTASSAVGTGAYSFGGLPSGSFDLSFTPPAAPVGTPAYSPAIADRGDPSLVDSDGDGPSGTADRLTGQALVAPADEARDRGYIQPVTVSGQVWFDSDNDGTRDAGEPPLANMSVEMISLGPDATLGGGDDTSDSVTTAVDGTYRSDGTPTLLPGQFVVRVTNPSTSDFVFLTTGTDNDIRATDAGPPPTGSTNAFAVASGATASNVDGALTGTSTINGKLFSDQNGDGRSLENVGLPGAQVALSHVVNVTVGPTTYLSTTFTRNLTPTPANGAYSFANLPRGTFSLSFTPPNATPAWTATVPDVGANANDADDSDTNLAAQSLAGNTTETRDGGFYQPVALSARVFDETSLPLNNQWETGEPGLLGASVQLTYQGPLTGADAPSIPAATTVAGGLVSFTVAPGDYQLDVTTPSGYTRSPGNTGSIDLAPLASGASATTEASPTGSTNVFGYFKPVAVSGRVWFDSDNDGVRDAGEPPLVNMPVEVISLGADNAIGGGDDTSDSVTTAADGSYSSDGTPTLLPGQFIVRVTNPSTSDFLFLTTGTDNAIRSTVAGPPATGSTSSFGVVSGATVANVDAALTGIKLLNGRAFVDANGDGQSGGDSGLPDVQVDLSHVVNVTVGPITYLNTTFTRTLNSVAPGGVYNFLNLPGGTFSLSFTPPTATPAWQLTTANVAPDTSDSDGDLTGQILAAGDTAQIRDQGYFQPVTLSARVFDEQVAVNNSFQPGEPGLSGITVDLAGTASASDTTDATGLVTFTVQPGTYSLTLPSDPASFLRSPGNSGSAGGITVTSGQAATTAPFGYYKQSTIGGTAWFDSDGDDLLTAGEPGMEGLTVTLEGSGGSTQTTVTDANGAYSFSGVDPTGLGGVKVTPQDSGGSLSAVEPNGPGGGDASYRLCFSLPTDFAYAGKGAALLTDDNSDVNPSGPDAGCTDSFTLGSNTTLSTLDAGYVGALTIGDLVWADLNGDGLQTTGEPGLAGATVTVAISTTGGLINSSDPTITLSTTSTASVGLAANYQLAGVPPGSGWRVLSVAPPFGYLPSATNQGSDDTLDSDLIGAYPVALPPAVANLDFGFYQATSVGDLVWLDLNGNGSYDAASERGVPNVRVDLLKDGGQVGTQTTAASGQVGSYGFVDITPGTYSLRFTAPAGYVFANDGAGSLEIDGDNDARLDGTSASFTLTSGQIRAGVDAGLRGTGGVSGLAWIDDNTNAIRDASDTRRIGGVQVTLSLTPTLTGDMASYTATTAADGSYSLTGLPAGAGTLRFSAGARYQAVQANVGTDTSDSDGPVVALTIVSGTALANVDQGYKELGRVIFLPLLRGVPQQPDLTVAFTVSPETPTAGKPASISATVTNKGTGPASGFWVDLYINPSHAPLVNEPWNELCTLEPCFGMAWFYEGTLQPGQSATLTSSPSSAANPNGFRAASSNWPGFFANGTSRIYIIVDSWNRNASGEQRDPNGALREIDETNNRAERSLTVLLGPLPPEFLQATLTSEFTRNEP